VAQRKVGFEFETNMETAAVTPGSTAKALRTAAGNPANFETREYLDAAGHGPLRGPATIFNAMGKKDPIVNVRGNPFTAEADESVDSGKSYLEYVTKPFDETKAGAGELSTAMGTIVAMHSDLIRRSLRAKGNPTPVRSKELSKFGTPAANTAIFASAGATNATIQASVGLRLDQVATLMSAIGGKQANESVQHAGRLAHSREMLGKGLGGPVGAVTDQTANITGASPRYARQAIADAQVDMNRGLAALGSTQDAMRKLTSVVALLVQYILTAPSVSTYPKVMAPLMARTDFGTLFGQLDATDKILLEDDDGDPFVELVVDAAGRRGVAVLGSQPLAPNVYSDARFAGARASGFVAVNMLAGLSREAWLRGIVQGTDYLSAVNFRTAVPGAPAHAEDHIESMGQFVGHTDPVGTDGVPGSVFEIRTAGVLPFGAWYSHAMDIFNYILDMNDGGSAVFRSTFLDLATNNPPLWNRMTSGNPKTVRKAMKGLTARAQNDILHRFG